MLKTLHEKVRIVVMLCLAIMILAVPAYAIFNRIVGGNVVAGDGLKLGANDPDTMHVQVADLLAIYGDSVGLDTTAFWTYMLESGGHVESTMVVDGGIGAADLHINAVGNAQCEQLDSTWITDGSIGTSTIKNGGIFNEDVADYTLDSAKATNTFVKGISESGGTWVSGYVTFSEGTDITITQSSNDIEIAYSGAGGNYNQFWGAEQMGVKWTTSDSVAVVGNIGDIFNGLTHSSFVRSLNTSQTVDDQEDTIIFSGRLPMGFDQDIDSITFGYRTSTTTAATSGVIWQVFAMADLSGYAPEDTLKMAGAQVASSSAGIWDWLSIPIADSSQKIGAGSWIFVYAICAMDYTTHAETVDVEPPLFWGSAK